MRRIGVLIVVLTALAVALLVPAVPAAGSRPPGRPLPAFVLDGMAFGYLPPGLGTTTDFAYHFQRVDFIARVWESQIPEGWTVDLDVDVMRGKRLTSGLALHDWFISYDQRPPAEAHYVATRVNGHPGWRCQDQVFWLVHPGLAISVQLNKNRWNRRQLMSIALSAREVAARR
jgi:hypothetical protein